jgi:hypothetical protein
MFVSYEQHAHTCAQNPCPHYSLGPSEIYHIAPDNSPIRHTAHFGLSSYIRHVDLLLWLSLSCSTSNKQNTKSIELQSHSRTRVKLNLQTEFPIRIQFVRHRKHYVPATEPNRLMLYGETNAVYCENHMEYTNTFCGQNTEL